MAQPKHPSCANPTSSSSTTSTLGAPGGADGSGGQYASDSQWYRPMLPLNSPRSTTALLVLPAPLYSERHDPGMRIGINGSSLIALNRPVSEIVDHAVEAEGDGFASYWVAQLEVPDALTMLGAVGRETSTIELGTAV